MRMRITFIAASLNRGYDTIQSHFQPAAAGHQLCMAHLMRELNYFEQRYKSPWATKCKNVFMRSMVIKKQMQADLCQSHQLPRSLIETDMDQLLSETLDPKHKEVITFQKRMTKYRGHLFTFLYHASVPPDNNGSERAIRNIKVKQKVSGQFKSSSGAQGFAILRSVTDTAIKNGQNVLSALLCVASLKVTDWLLTSNYWLNKDELVALEFEGNCLLAEEEDDDK